MSELSVLSRRRVLALLAAFLMAGPTRAWSKDGDSGGDSDGGGSDHGGSGGGDSSGHGGDDHDNGDGDSSGHGGGDGDGDDGGGRGRGRGGDDDDDDGDKDRDDDDLSDQDYARRGVERGDMVPLSSVLRTVRAAKPGRVVNVDLVRTTRRGAIYRVVVMGSEHDLWQISVDARRNRVLGMRRY